MSFEIFLVISHKTVKSAKNTICDTCAQNSRRYEFCDIFAHTVVISRKTVKLAKNTICDTWAQNLRRYISFVTFLLIQLIKDVKRSNQIGTGFLILVHRTGGDMSFLTFLLKQLEKSPKTVKSTKYTICEPCAQKSWRNELCDIFPHTVITNRKMVKSARNTIYDTCAQNSWRYEFCDIFVIQL